VPKKALDQIPVTIHFILACAALVGAFILLLLLWQHWFWLSAAAALSFLYTAPKIPLRITRFLQKIAYGKTIFLTLAWTYITAVLPLLITNTPILTQHIIFCVNRFYLIYAICILFDLRDRESDRKEGIKGMVTQFNLEAVDLVYWGSIIVYIATSLALVFYLPMQVVFAFLIPGLILTVGYSWFKKQETEFVYNFLLDGLMIFSLPLLLLFGI
jgi:4-hydroxybenzoate polyprenyltransferase